MATDIAGIDNWGNFIGYLGRQKYDHLNKFMIIEDKVYEIHKVIVHQFRMGDVEDPDLYAAEPLLEWQNSEMGKWIMERSIETPMWARQQDPYNYGFQYAITAWLKGPDHTFWQMKWGSSNLTR